MSRMHAPENNRLTEHHNDGGSPTAACPVCGAEMNPGKLPDHIGSHGGDDE